MTAKPEKHVEDAWIALLRAKDKAFSTVELTLKKNGLPPFAWYDILWELEKAGNEGLRPYELEKRLLLTQYGISRLLDRLQKAGYVKKTPCKIDGRGHQVSVTKDGRQIRKKIWITYAQAIQNVVGDKLTETQCRQLTTLLTPLQ